MNDDDVTDDYDDGDIPLIELKQRLTDPGNTHVSQIERNIDINERPKGGGGEKEGKTNLVFLDF
jgi:hypothetical protein